MLTRLLLVVAFLLGVSVAAGEVVSAGLHRLSHRTTVSLTADHAARRICCRPTLSP